MDDRVDIRPGLVDGCVDYPLLIRLGLRAREDVSFQIEFEDIPLVTISGARARAMKKVLLVSGFRALT